MSSVSETGIARRRVFYIPGYDPFHPRRYRELYRKESAAQAAISGYEIDLSPARAGQARYGWHVQARIGGAAAETDFSVLVWSDIVRESMDQGITATYLQLLRTAWIYIGSGTLWRLMRLRKGPVIAALYPVVFLLGQLLLAVAAGALLLAAGEALLVPALGDIGQILAAALAVGGGYGLLRWFKAKDNKVFAHYLMHDYAHAAARRGAYPPELEARIADFAAEIAAALDEEMDEVLVVGHSSGAYLGVSILADLLRRRPLPAKGAALSFLTLGQVVPMASFLPGAQRLRADLRLLSASEALTWVDVTAPGDGCAFALCDPVAVTGVAPEGKRWPLVISCAFTKTLSAERWKALRWRFFRLHFQYLCAFDRPGDYDYFQITAGPATLATRYAGRAPSPSRITRAISKHTGVAA